MGMFDWLYHNGRCYQTKDTPGQFLGEYEIRGDELWYRDVDHEWVEDSDHLFGGHLEEVSAEWVPLTDFSGSVQYCDNESEYLALFWEGKMIRNKRLDDTQGDK
jgi:hypothetical protein